MRTSIDCWKCGVELKLPASVVWPVHCKCGASNHSREGYPSSWPAWALSIKRLSKPVDAGVGDTVNRLLGKFGERFKQTMKWLGVECGCEERQAEWNKLYPYA